MNKISLILGPALLAIFILSFTIALFLPQQQQFTRDARELENRIRRNAEMLESASGGGTLSGSPGLEAAQERIIARMRTLNLEPEPWAPDFSQNFYLPVPRIDDRNYRFRLPGMDREAVMDADFSVMIGSYSRGIEYRGALILAGDSLAQLPDELCEGRIIVVEDWRLNEESIELARKKGAAGLIFAAGRNIFSPQLSWTDQSLAVDLNEKRGMDLFIAVISPEMNRALKSDAGAGEGAGATEPWIETGPADIYVKMDFPVLESRNLIARLPAQEASAQDARAGSPLPDYIISAALDSTTPDRTRSDGGNTELYSAAVLLSLMEELGSSSRPPQKSIGFIFYSGVQQGSYGPRALHSAIENQGGEPARVIHLAPVHPVADAGIPVLSSNQAGRIFADRLGQFSANAGSPLPSRNGGLAQAAALFADRGIPSIELRSSLPQGGSALSDPGDPDFSRAAAALSGILAMLESDVYGNRVQAAAGYPAVQWGISLFLWLAFGLYLGGQGSRARSAGFAVPEWYVRLGQGKPLRAAQASLASVGTIAAALFIFVLIIHLPPDGMQIPVGGGRLSNIVPALSLRRGFAFIENLVRADLSTSAIGGNLLKVFVSSFLASIRLLGSALLLATGIAFITAFLETRRAYYGRSSGHLPSIFLSSLPDVALVLLFLLAYVALARQAPQLHAAIRPQEFLFPVLSVAMLPAAFLVRSSALLIQEEMSSPHLLYARSKGFGPGTMFRQELSIPLLSRMLESIPALSSLILTNLVVVEYLFNYQGVVFYLLYFYQIRDISSFVLLAGGIIGLYLLLSGTSSLLLSLVHPLRKGVRA